MKKSQILFKAIDVVFEKSQNPYNFDNIYFVKDIPYSNASKNYTSGDLYFNPLILKDGKKHPIILNIHGGGFVMGDKHYRKTLSEFYASKDFFVYNVNYRLPPKTDIFGCIHDVIDAANHIKKLSEEYNIDIDRIVITGDSSGAFLASYIACVKFNPEIAEKLNLPQVEINIAALILHSGPYNMEAMINEDLPLGLTTELASMLVGYQLNDDLSDIKNYKYYNYMSPINFVNDKWCPTFISWSDTDVICPDQGRPMAEKLMKHCPKVATFYAEGLRNGHCFHLSIKKEKAMQCLENSISFCQQIFEENG